MVTVTTKTINYTITKGNRTNAVNATITSTPGFNVRTCKSPNGLVKLVQLILAIIALVLLIIKMRRDGDMYEEVLQGHLPFWCMLCATIISLVIFLISHASSTTSWILVTRTTHLEIVYNVVMGLLMLIASVIALIFLHTSNAYEDEYIIRLIADIIGVIIAILFFVGAALAQKELKGSARHGGTNATNGNP